MGARLLGDYEDAAYNRNATRKAFYRLALSGDGSAIESAIRNPKSAMAFLTAMRRVAPDSKDWG